jgi:hypothetical protein
MFALIYNTPSRILATIHSLHVQIDRANVRAQMWIAEAFPGAMEYNYCTALSLLAAGAQLHLCWACQGIMDKITNGIGQKLANERKLNGPADQPKQCVLALNVASRSKQCRVADSSCVLRKWRQVPMQLQQLTKSRATTRNILPSRVGSGIESTAALRAQRPAVDAVKPSFFLCALRHALVHLGYWHNLPNFDTSVPHRMLLFVSPLYTIFLG